jgi:hypothetical protein
MDCAAMRNNSTGGMQTRAANYSIICPKCGRPAARVSIEINGTVCCILQKLGIRALLEESQNDAQTGHQLDFVEIFGAAFCKEATP